MNSTLVLIEFAVNVVVVHMAKPSSNAKVKSPDCSKATLQGIIRGHVDLGTVIHSDGWRGYEGLVDIGYDKHFRVKHGAYEFANGERHINGIESFWSYAKRRLAKFNGIAKHKFYMYMKETEYRFNHRHAKLYLEILKILRNNTL
jgi:transposase